MKSRRLRHRAEFYGIVNKKNREGKVVKQEEYLGTIYCEPLKQTVKEFVDKGYDFDARRINLNLMVRYKQRFEIKNDQKIKFKGNEYYIKTIEPNYEDMDYLMIGCEIVG